ncbi:FAD:protein FMN transferase [Pseudorhodobacter turbinis]
MKHWVNPTRKSTLTLHDAAVATSGDYRHWVTVQSRRLSYPMVPMRAAPLLTSPASVTVIATTCAAADAWATALMVAGANVGLGMAEQAGLDALFLIRDDAGGVQSRSVGPLFTDNSPTVGD